MHRGVRLFALALASCRAPMPVGERIELEERLGRAIAAYEVAPVQASAGCEAVCHVASDAVRIADTACAQLELHPSEDAYARLCADAIALWRLARTRCRACATRPAAGG